MGEATHNEQLRQKINDSNYKIKIVGMTETPMENTVRSFIYSRLELTQSTKG